MGIRKDYKQIEDFIKAVTSSNVSQVFVFDAIGKEQGEPVSRTSTNEQGIPTEAFLVPSAKVTNAIVLSAEEIKVFGSIKENYFHYYEEVFVDLVAEGEFEENQAKKETRIGEIYHLFAEKCPEILLIRGRVSQV